MDGSGKGACPSPYRCKRQSCAILDELRYLLATTTDKPSRQLPPIEDAFKQHSLRACYQTMVWCKSHIAKPELVSPVSKGWFHGAEGLRSTIFTQESVPAELKRHHASLLQT